MGGSGKSTLLRHMIGLIEPTKRNIFYGDENFTKADFELRQELLRRMGKTRFPDYPWSLRKKESKFRVFPISPIFEIM